MYREDFGYETEKILKYIEQFLDESKKKNLRRVMRRSEGYKVVFSEYDWSLKKNPKKYVENQKLLFIEYRTEDEEKIDIQDLTFETIISNNDLRKHFKKFCKMEW